MYAILSGGELLALCDRPRYVKINEDSGAYVEAEAAEAIGVSVRGELYNINGGDAIPDAPEAVVKQGDAAEYVFQNRARILEGEETVGTALVEIEDAICEMDAATGENMTALEVALCELDVMISEMNGGNDDE